MASLANVSIRNKLILGFSVVVSLFLVTTVFAINEQKEINQLNAKIQAQDVVLIEKISELEKSLIGVALQMREVDAGLKYNDEGQIRNAIKSMNQYRQQIPTLMNIVSKRFEGDQAALGKAKDAAIEYASAHYDYSQKAIAKKDNGDIYLNRLVPIRKKIWPLFEPVKKSAYDQIDRHAKKVEKLSEYSLYVQSIAIVVAIILSAIIAIYIARSLTSNINKVVETAGLLAKGDFRHPCMVSAGDETGKMASALNNSLDQLNGALYKVKETTDLVLNVANVTKSSVSGIKTLSTRQSENVNSISVSSEELVSTLSEVANELSQISQSAKEMIDNAKVEASRSHEVDNLFKQIEASMKDSTESISQLAEQSSDIVSILDVIKDIAEQTNLLALNAAIEAARAGEQGRGFAVVADEVRTLAQKTQDSTTQIEAMLTDLKSVTGRTVSTITKSDEQVKNGSSLMQAAKEGIEHTRSMIEAVNSRIEGIAQMTEQQANVSQDIGKSIVELSDLSKDVSDFSQRAENETESLFDYNQQLVSLINEFELK